MVKLVRAGLVRLIMTMVISTTVIYASSNLSTPAPAGAGSSAISGFVVLGVEYQQAANPSQVEAVGFNLDRAASTVLIKLVSSDPNIIAYQNTSIFNGTAPSLMRVRWPAWMNYASWCRLNIDRTVTEENDL